MKDSTEKFLKGLAIGAGIVMGMLIMFGLTPADQLRKDRQEAIAHGAAKWVANPTNGVVTFQWNDNK